MRSLLIITIVLFSYSLSAQMLSNQGTLVSVKGNAFVAVHGDVRNDNNGTFHNSNEIHCFGDWENNANNEAFTSVGAGIVHLQGDNQRIKGTSITRFYDLRLENTGIKYGDIDVYVNGYLRLNDRELRMDNNTVHVFNTELAAVSHTQNASVWGMVAALGNGGLLRHTNSDSTYFYPVGSDLSPARFRPVNITPSTNNTAAYKVRMANVDATTEGWDRSLTSFNICEVNPLYFHRISQTQGNVDATVGLFYDAAQDGTFQGVGKWMNTNMWDLAAPSVQSTNATYAMDVRRTSTAISSFAPNAFALTQVAPDAELLATPNPVCSNEALTLTASTQGTPFTNYDFYINGALVQSSSSTSYTTDSMTVGMIPIWVVGSYADCGDQSDTTMLEVWQGVTAQAYADTIIVEGTPANLAATGGDFYNWLPDTALSCSICSTTTATPDQTTTYVVEVESLDGCSDTASVTVEVRENVAQVLFIPNVLTPNNDGFNDTWFIKNIHLFPNNAVKIFNRWGDIVFSSRDYQNDWDGTFGEGLLPAGTYYYVLDVGGTWGVFKGDVTILRE